MEKKFFEGVITKAVGGNYTVVTTDGVLTCNARGIFRKNKISPSAGDNVIVTTEENNIPLISEIKERKNYIIRPPIANLDMALIVSSAVDPAPNTLITDKLISIFESKGIEPVIILTKTDLENCDSFAEIYRSCGFEVIYMDNVTGEGIEIIRKKIKGRTSALIGNSGVGKSSLMNILFPDLKTDTGDISKKLGRGRHTTRQVEFYALPDGGYIADTPGFSTVEVSKYGFIPKDELQYSFREFEEYLSGCQFRDCVHLKEKGCLITKAVEEGKIQVSRYESYKRMYDEADKLNEWEFKSK